MNFKQATDELIAALTLEDLAKAMRISLQSLRQARSSETSTSHRSPPPDWERAVARLAKAQSLKMARLAARLESD